ncbi:hypothetical protein BU24DRAFT_480093 [Aaosphaeria arxii CBS 175.79]|uniref:Protein kinase domain-containing protein n=1 Tax=Aaosphaeria arxii CBS 175.79 TaxID=1450172 RepID=A0A6A5XQX1_9PLEO|nr:uncharacterized protein BU24DRAFT_480093 [Aaosphaeria arxii CBS 175.79]KAF2015299.1 hypothetical protein BU24DRAFT_480093 [Aaosphaeria arxii CBS 175.79]
MVKSLVDCRTIQFSKLRELDRLGPAVDLRLYQDEEGQQRKVVFKIYATYKPRPISMFWPELHLFHRLPPHPNLLALDRVVLEDIESRVIGFTTRYISGGTLDNMAIVFRLEWLKQLLQVVDFLNLELGVMHQDTAPRNILLNTETDKILLYDINYSASKKDDQLVDQDDVAGVTFTLHELIPGDQSFTAGHQRRNGINMVRDMPNWIPKRELNAEVSEFRRVLNDWTMKRTADGNMMERYLNATSPILIPEMPTPPDYEIPISYGATANGEPVWDTGP